MRGVDRGGATITVVRTRVVAALVGMVALVAGVTVIVSLSTHEGAEHASGVVTVDAARLHPGDVLAPRFTVQAKNSKEYSYFVFVADVPHQGIIALLGRSTALGCRVTWVNAAGYQRGVVPRARRWYQQHPEIVCEDPCQGGLWALNGDCLGGNCPRGLARFPATLTGTALRINLNAINLGRKRQPTAQLAPFS